MHVRGRWYLKLVAGNCAYTCAHSSAKARLRTRSVDFEVSVFVFIIIFNLFRAADMNIARKIPTYVYVGSAVCGVYGLAILVK